MKASPKILMQETSLHPLETSYGTFNKYNEYKIQFTALRTLHMHCPFVIDSKIYRVSEHAQYSWCEVVSRGAIWQLF